MESNALARRGIPPGVRSSPRRSLAVAALAALLAVSTTAAAEPDRARADPRPTTSATPIALADAVARGLARNPTFEIARAESLRTEALLREVSASFLPTVTGNAAYTHLDSPRTSGGAVLLPQNGLNASLLLTVPLVVPRQWATASEARANLDAQRATTADVRRQVALTVGRAYLAVYTQKLVIEVDERARDTAKKHYDYAHQRYAGGVGTSLDEVRASQEVATDEALLQQAYSALATAQEALGVAVGEDGPLDSRDDPQLAEPPPLAAGLVDAAHRTDVVAADLRKTAAERVTHHDYTDYLPYLVGTAQAFAQDPTMPTVPASGYQLELVLTLPLYDGGLRYGQARERDALATEARVGADAQLRQARSDVRAAFEGLRRADEALAMSRDAARLAKQGLDLANLAYTHGATTDIEVIDAERVARDAETQAAVAADSARQARLVLLWVTNHFP